VWFDSHCHLDLCEDRGGRAEDIVERAVDAGLVGILTLGTDEATSRRAVELSAPPLVWAAVGVHPNSADEWDDATASRMTEMLSHERVVAVGETGLDFFRDRVPPVRQHDAFQAHIELAKEYGKALVIHTRESVDEALDTLARVGPPGRLVFHCWSGEKSHLDRALGLGAYISFAGNVSFPKSEALRDLAAIVPDDRLLVETDSPFLTPVPHRGKPNEPRNVAFVGLAVAQARNIDTHLLAEMTSRNARALFGLQG
jgi:TatD DNase family protein